MKEIFFIKGNHIPDFGIVDHFEIFESIFKQQEYKVIYSEYPVNGKINIIFDEFTNLKFNKLIKKKTINTKYILVVTEFITKFDNNLFTFNNFEYKKNKFLFYLINKVHYPLVRLRFYFIFNIIKAILRKIIKLINLTFVLPYLFIKHFIINIYLFIYFILRPLIYKKNLNNFKDHRKKIIFFLSKNKKRFLDLFYKTTDFILTKILKINHIKLFLNKHIKSIFPKNYQRIIYDHLRFLAFIENIFLFDEVLTLHGDLSIQYSNLFNELNIKTKVSDPLLPLFNVNRIINSLKTKKYSFYTSGTQTNYRKKLFTELKNNINKNNTINKVFGKLEISDIKFIHRSFDDKKRYDFLYSFHAPQTSNWLYSSPVRLFRAINVECSIPIIYKKYNDHPVEDLCILLDSNISETTAKLYLNSTFVKSYENNLKSFNKISIENNLKVLDEIKSLH